MVLDPEFRRQMTATVFYFPPTGTYDSAGIATYGGATVTLMRVEEWEAVVQKFPGEFVVSTHRYYADGAITLERNTLFSLPGGTSSVTLARRPVLFKTLPGEDGSIHHYEIWV